MDVVEVPARGVLRVVGGAHAEIYEGLPGCANVGFVVEGVYHPGDSLFVPDVPVTTLLVPWTVPPRMPLASNWRTAHCASSAAARDLSGTL